MGTDIPLAEERLQVALECCKLWNAVFLIDEADVFLGARTATSTVQQNELVSSEHKRSLHSTNWALLMK